MSEAKPMRELLPGVAALADDLRTWFGAEFVDKQIARATRARREYLRIHREQGAEAAEEWRRLNWREATFYGREEGARASIGMTDPSSERGAITPNIDERILRAAQAGGSLEAKRVAWAIAAPRVRGRVQTSAHDEGTAR